MIDKQGGTHMRRLISLALALCMAALCCASVSAAETPAPPAWVKADEYTVFAGDAVYGRDAWNRILRLRADAAAGNREPQEGDALYSDWDIWVKYPNGTSGRKELSAGEWFERGLIAMQYAANSDTGRKSSTAYWCFTELGHLLPRQTAVQADLQHQLDLLWLIRASFLNWGPTAAGEDLYSICSVACQSYVTLKKSREITLNAVFDTPLMDGLSPAGRARIQQEVADIVRRVLVSLDGEVLSENRVVNNGREIRNDPVVVNGRTMVPIRWIAERLGADVEWVAATKAASLIRAGVRIDLPIGSTTAYRNGVAFEMDVAPYVKDGSTMIPVRYVAEFFQQKVSFRSETRTVEITENKELAGNSNLESWALPMGAMLNKLNGRDGPGVLGGFSRAGGAGLSSRKFARNILNSASWGILSREDLIATVTRMTAHGHNDSFLADAAWINGMTGAEYQNILKNAQGMDVYMFPYTKQLAAKWGTRGILCWDLFRMSNLVQWGYLAGYVTYGEALALLEPAARALHDNFTSWDQAYENYLDGYNWWARNNVLDQNIWETTRGKYYQTMKADRELQTLFDDALFRTPVVGVPGLTAEQLLASVQ